MKPGLYHLVSTSDTSMLIVVEVREDGSWLMSPGEFLETSGYWTQLLAGELLFPVAGGK